MSAERLLLLIGRRDQQPGKLGHVCPLNLCDERSLIKHEWLRGGRIPSCKNSRKAIANCLPYYPFYHLGLADAHVGSRESRYRSSCVEVGFHAPTTVRGC